MVFVRKVFPELTNAGPASLPQRKVRKWNLQIGLGNVQMECHHYMKTSTVKHSKV